MIYGNVVVGVNGLSCDDEAMALAATLKILLSEAPTTACSRRYDEESEVTSVVVAANDAAHLAAWRERRAQASAR
ncbi:MAG TPA: hypothetical protein VG388_09035 [Solirubrobacteraceae bacterium]|nr:hypothetical protein [Solirubrobacteraceae bacterium]